MQKNQLFKKSLCLLLLCTALIALTMSSCNDKKKADKDLKKENASGSFKMNCVILKKAQVQAWVDSGWTNPANPNRISMLLLQFYSNSASAVNNKMQLITYPGKNMFNVFITGETVLEIDTTCVPVAFPGPTIFGNNATSLTAMNIIKPDGTLANFDFIRFIPTITNTRYIVFKIEIVTIGLAKPDEKGTTNPCPPCQYCNPPCPEGLTSE